MVCSLEGPVPAAPEARRSQISPVWVVALPKFLTPAQSTTSQLVGSASLVESRAIRIAPAAVGFRSLQNGATTLFGRAAFGNCWGLKTRSPLVPPPITT